MLKTNSLEGNLSIFLVPSNHTFTLPETLAISSFFQALRRNTTLKSLSINVPNEMTQNLWEALRENGTLQELTILEASRGRQLPESWERNFLFSVLPSLSLIELRLGFIELSADEITGLWFALRVSCPSLKSLEILTLQSEVEWEHFCVLVLPMLSLKHLAILNFQPKVAGWDRLLQSVENNFCLESFECNYFDRIWEKAGRFTCEELDEIDDDDEDVIQNDSTL